MPVSTSAGQTHPDPGLHRRRPLDRSVWPGPEDSDAISVRRSPPAPSAARPFPPSSRRSHLRPLPVPPPRPPTSPAVRVHVMSRPRKVARMACAPTLAFAAPHHHHSVGSLPNCLDKGMPVRTWRLRELYTKIAALIKTNPHEWLGECPSARETVQRCPTVRSSSRTVAPGSERLSDRAQKAWTDLHKMALSTSGCGKHRLASTKWP